MLAATLIFISSLLIFSYIADENVLENNNAFDTKVMVLVTSLSTPLLIRVMHVFTFFGSTQFLLPAYCMLAGYFLYKRNIFFAWSIVLIAVSSTAFMYLLKFLFKRHRPVLPHVKIIIGYGFPSGHSISSLIFFSILAYITWLSSIRKVLKYFAIFLLLLFSLLIGISRIVLNVHFATDVIAGFCFGIMWLLLSYFLLVKFKKKTL